MTGKTIVDKALAYILDHDRLLVLRHVDDPPGCSGIFVPGGTVRREETPAQAALREAREETGLDNLILLRKLGQTRYDISPLRPEIQRRHFFQLALAGPAPERWPSAELHDGLQPPTPLECFWIPLSRAHFLASGHGAQIHRVLEGAADRRDPRPKRLLAAE